MFMRIQNVVNDFLKKCTSQKAENNNDILYNVQIVYKIIQVYILNGTWMFFFNELERIKWGKCLIFTT